MVTKYERELQRAEVAKRMRDHADAVHAVASRVPFWRLDDTGGEIMIRDLDGHRWPRSTAFTLLRWPTGSR